MNVFKTKEKGVEYVEIHPFKLEWEIQELVEKNTETFFILQFVRFPIIFSTK
jgi:hypothetical protein